MTIKLFRSISCIAVNSFVKNNKDEKTQIKKSAQDNLWKTFSEATEEEQDLLKKVFQANNNNNSSSDRYISANESKSIKYKKSIKRKITVKKSDSISDIYHKARAKLPSIKILTDHQQSTFSDPEPNIISDDSLDAAIPAQLTRHSANHQEVYFNTDFEEQSLTPRILSRPLPPVPNNE